MQLGRLTSNEAAGKALQLCAARARLCEVVGAKVPRASQSLALRAGVTTTVSEPGHSSAAGDAAICSLVQDVSMAGASTASSAPPPLSPQVDGLNSVTGLTEETLAHTIAECRSSENYAKLRRLLWAVFSNEVALRHSFLQRSESVEKTSESVVTSSKSTESVGAAQSKEEIRAQEGDLDKDLDCAEDTCEGEGAIGGEAAAPEGDTKDPCKKNNTLKSTTLDINEVRRAYTLLFDCPEAEFSSTLTNAVVQLLSDSLGIQLRVYKDAFAAIPNNINIFVILLESPAVNTTDFIEGVMPRLCRTIGQLPDRDQAHLTRHLATWEASRLHRLLESLHQLITIRLLTTEFLAQELTINDEEGITSATQVMKLLFYASILGGKLDTPLLQDLPPEDASQEPSAQEDPFSSTGKDWAARPPPKDSLGSELGIHVLDARTPLVSLTEFYDDFLSDQLEMDRDFAYYKAGSGDKFSFLNYPFILTPATKALGLYYDNRIRMYSERRISIYQQVIEGMAANPYLKLRVRRDHIIDDALVEVSCCSTNWLSVLCLVKY